MKKIFFLYHFLLFCPLLWAQVPDRMNYQAVVRDQNGSAIELSPVIVRFSFRQTNLDGPVRYQEVHNTITNEYGMIHLMITEGTVTYGSYDDVVWGDADYVLQVEIDAGNGFVDMGGGPFASVPFAYHSTKAVNMALDDLANVEEHANNVAPTNNQYLGFNEDENWWQPMQLPSESQVLSVNGSAISISGGNTVQVAEMWPASEVNYINFAGLDLWHDDWPVSVPVSATITFNYVQAGLGFGINCGNANDGWCIYHPALTTVHFPTKSVITEFNLFAEGNVKVSLYRQEMADPSHVDNMVMVQPESGIPVINYPVIDNANYLYFIVVESVIVVDAELQAFISNFNLHGVQIGIVHP